MLLVLLKCTFIAHCWKNEKLILIKWLTVLYCNWNLQTLIDKVGENILWGVRKHLKEFLGFFFSEKTLWTAKNKLWVIKNEQTLKLLYMFLYCLSLSTVVNKQKNTFWQQIQVSICHCHFILEQLSVLPEWANMWFI